MLRSFLISVLAASALTPRPSPGQARAAADDLPALARAFLSGLPVERERAEAALRARGAAAARVLLESLEGEPEARVLDALCELMPAAATEDFVRRARAWTAASRARVVDWLARRDLEGGRAHAPARARALLAVVRQAEQGGPRADVALAVRAAEALAEYDLDLAARGLADSLKAQLSVMPRRALALACARSFARLRAASAHVEALAAVCAQRAPWLAGLLLPAFRRRPEAVLAGSVDAWARVRSPAVAQAFRRLIANIDRDLHAAQEHERRFELFERFRREMPLDLSWALRAAHVALIDLSDPALARAPLTALEASEPQGEASVESALLHAIARFLAGEDPSAWLRASRARSDEAWSDDDWSGLRDQLLGATASGFAIQRAWREQLAPRLGPDEFERRRRRFVREGGDEGRAWRAAGRRRLAVELVAALLNELRGDAGDARACFARVAELVQALEADWDFARSGEPGDLEAALSLRCGPYDLLERALEGSEATAERLRTHARLSADAVKARVAAWRAQARRGFRALIAELARAVPSRVLPLPGMKLERQAQGRERAYLDVSGAYARFLHRLGEEADASAILVNLIAALDSAGLWRNQRVWAGYLFDHAGIEIDRRNAASAKASLTKYLEHYGNALQDVRQAPERYVDAKVARDFFASRLATGHISMAVLHNVVLHQGDVAREHCRQAFALEDNPFNRVLYACYLARDDKADEAAALLATVDPAPALYYNMACTYALSGQSGKALEFLALDLKWNHATDKARNRQREWPEKDRDLESLRSDERFRELVRRR